jgi:hypothetical protein
MIYRLVVSVTASTPYAIPHHVHSPVHRFPRLSAGIVIGCNLVTRSHRDVYTYLCQMFSHSDQAGRDSAENGQASLLNGSLNGFGSEI